MTIKGGYRRDIDGLRALAILPVLFYHAGVPGFSGGYVGVDVFFVISGFLITGIIAREFDEGRFSLVRFYERRARRILPALFTVIAFVLATAAWLYLPGDFEKVPRSALATLLFLANGWFFTQTGYFAGGAETMPLLHCWSLAVEEQFYIGFPILLWITARYAPRWRLPAIAAVALVSFAWAWWTQADNDGFAFYLLPTRAWELFAGALLALGAVPPIERKWLREVAALIGLAALLAPVFVYGHDTVFPGITALPPVLGTALLLHTAPGCLVGRLLSLRIPVGIGLISYSLYLWHWPLIVFAEYALEGDLHGAESLAVIAAAFALAWLSWRYVERPFRTRGRFSARQIFVVSGAGAAALAAVALALLPLGGWADRFPPEVTRYASAAADFSPKRDACLSAAIGGDRPECNIGAQVAPTALLWGDSHGVELAWVLGQAMGQRGEALMQRTRGSCPPVIGYDPPKEPNCAPFNQEVLERIARTPSIRTVYLAAFWESATYRVPGMADRIGDTIARLRRLGRRVVLIGPVPGQPFNVPRHLALAAARGDLADVRGGATADYRRDVAWFDRALPAWHALGAESLDPTRALIDGDHLRIVADGSPLYFDSHHLSLAGARLVLGVAGQAPVRVAQAPRLVHE
jgi:peptidoglycan/LPS O-acetylase OafA/YrhL